MDGGSSMRRAVAVQPEGAWDPGQYLVTVTLAFNDRHRRRVRLVDDTGQPFLLDLAQATLLRDGDALVMAEGGVIAVRAAAEHVLDITCRNAAHCTRVAWHLGNRHQAVQVVDETHLRIHEDPVIAAMVEGLGARVDSGLEPFEPEGGAYDTSGAGGGHGHGSDHEHAHGREFSHA